MIWLDVINSPQSWLLLLVGLTCYTINHIRKNRSSKVFPPTSMPIPRTRNDSVQPANIPSLSSKPQDGVSSTAPYYTIEPLPDFDLSSTPPEKIRPFKPKYHLTMALTNTTFSDLLALDQTHTSRLALRTKLIKSHESEVLACNPAAEPAVLELYTWLIKTYLPARYPTLYTLHPDGLQDHTTSTTLPLSPPSAKEALRLLGQTIDTDFLILLPVPSPSPTPQKPQPTTSSTTPKYTLEAFQTCFPSGFRTRSKLGLQLAAIHAPVPGYAQRLEKSMDRFFANLPVGKIVKRTNWTVTTTRDLFCLSGTHGDASSLSPSPSLSSPTLEIETETPPQESLSKAPEELDLDIAQTVLRCERQTLHRLPETGALVFAFKTYQYELEDVRDEGLGEGLACAIEGLGEGNAPRMRGYKRGDVWGERVCALLRGGGGKGGGA